MLAATASRGHNALFRGIPDRTSRPVRLTLSYSLQGVGYDLSLVYRPSSRWTVRDIHGRQPKTLALLNSTICLVRGCPRCITPQPLGYGGIHGRQSRSQCDLGDYCQKWLVYTST